LRIILNIIVPVDAVGSPACIVALDDGQIQRRPDRRLSGMASPSITSAHVRGLLQLLQVVITRSMMGVPYLDSPI